MLHDAPYLNEARFRRAAASTLDRYNDEFYERIRRAERLVIALAGGSGSGKTSIACILCRLFNSDPRCNPAMFAKHLYADDLYLANYRGDMPGLRGLARRENRFEGIGPAEYNWAEEISPCDSISRLLSMFREAAGRRVCTIPCVDVLTQQIDALRIDFNQQIGLLVAGRDEPMRKLGSVNILIIDGLYAIDRRMGADYNFYLEANYYQDKAWGHLRPSQFDTPEFTERLARGDGLEAIEGYAREVVRNIGSRQQQDVRGKEGLTEDRLVSLELEHQAIQQLRRDCEQRSSAGEFAHFAVLRPVAD